MPTHVHPAAPHHHDDHEMSSEQPGTPHYYDDPQKTFKQPDAIELSTPRDPNAVEGSAVSFESLLALSLSQLAQYHDQEVKSLKNEIAELRASALKRPPVEVSGKTIAPEPPQPPQLQLSPNPPATPILTEAASLSELKRAVGKIVRDIEREAAELRRKVMKHPMLHGKQHVARHESLYGHTPEYHSEGICQNIAKSPKFELTTLAIVSVNAIWIAIDADVNGSKVLLNKPPLFILMEFCFALYFFCEWAIRLLAHRQMLTAWRDAWFVFDTVLVVLMIVDIFIGLALGSATRGQFALLRIFRLVKITKMGRMARILRHYPELAVMLKAMFVAIRSVACTSVLIFGITYLFAVTFRILTMDTVPGARYYPSVPMSMKTLMVAVVFPDLDKFFEDMLEVGILTEALAIVFSILVVVTLLNMLIGILCEAIGTAAETQRETSKVLTCKEHFLAILKNEGYDDLGPEMQLTQDVFHKLMLNPKVVATVMDLGADPVDLVGFTDALFKKGGEIVTLSLEDFLSMVLHLGGTNTATVKHVVDMRDAVLGQLERIEEVVGIAHTKIDHVTKAAKGKVAGTSLASSASSVPKTLWQEMDQPRTPREKALEDSATDSNVESARNIQAGLDQARKELLHILGQCESEFQEQSRFREAMQTKLTDLDLKQYIINDSSTNYSTNVVAAATAPNQLNEATGKGGTLCCA